MQHCCGCKMEGDRGLRRDDIFFSCELKAHGETSVLTQCNNCCREPPLCGHKIACHPNFNLKEVCNESCTSEYLNRRPGQVNFTSRQVDIQPRWTSWNWNEWWHHVCFGQVYFHLCKSNISLLVRTDKLRSIPKSYADSLMPITGLCTIFERPPPFNTQ